MTKKVGDKERDNDNFLSGGKGISAYCASNRKVYKLEINKRRDNARRVFHVIEKILSS